MREPHRLMLEALRTRARTHTSNKRPNVNKPSLVPADHFEQESRSPLGVCDWILAGFAHRRKYIEGIGRGGVNDQVVAGYPFVKLPRCFDVSRQIANRKLG